jgi:hypothetical protein
VRVSAIRTSPHYHRFALVILDGQPQSFAVEADDLEGWVDVVDLENPMRLPASVGMPPQPSRYATKRLHGIVQIQEAP